MYVHVPQESYISSCNAQALSGTTATKFLNSLSSGNRYYLTSIQSADNEASTPVIVKILSESSLKWVLGGAPLTKNVPITFNPPLRMNDAEGVYVQLGSAIGQVFVSINGFKGY